MIIIKCTNCKEEYPKDKKKFFNRKNLQKSDSIQNCPFCGETNFLKVLDKFERHPEHY